MSSGPREHPRPARRPSFTVEMFREQDESTRVDLSCSLPEWDFLCELGKTFGWHPVGTTYLLRPGQRAQHVPIKHNYQPGDSRDRKRIAAQDCARWAAALEIARRSPFLPGMVKAHVKLQAGSEGGEAALQSLLLRFVQFARVGTFTVALKADS